MSTLSTAQLSRKRANDREAQRAIRQRTKEHIESLEQRIAELSVKREDASSRPGLEEALRRNADLERDLSLVKKELALAQSQRSTISTAYAASQGRSDLVSWCAVLGMSTYGLLPFFQRYIAGAPAEVFVSQFSILLGVVLTCPGPLTLFPLIYRCYYRSHY